MDQPEDELVRTVARRLYAERSDDNIEIDDDAEVNRNENGEYYWVQAWVWVTREDVEDGL